MDLGVRGVLHFEMEGIAQREDQGLEGYAGRWFGFGSLSDCCAADERGKDKGDEGKNGDGGIHGEFCCCLE